MSKKPNFEIFLKNDSLYREGVCLGFKGADNEHLYKKNVIFCLKEYLKLTNIKQLFVLSLWVKLNRFAILSFLINKPHVGQ